MPKPPVFIINRDRISTTKRLVYWLLNANTERIVIMDNASTYPPLLEWYKHLPKEVELVHVGKNIGWRCVYDDPRGKNSVNNSQYYVMTDSDVIPSECCPKDLLQALEDKLRQYPTRMKCGPGIRIDNLPDKYPRKQNVIDEQSPYWKNRLDAGCFAAGIDTTFAMYRRCQDWPGTDDKVCIRMDFPYVIEHTPWYIWPITKEERYYAERVLPPPISHQGTAWRLMGAME